MRSQRRQSGSSCFFFHLASTASFAKTLSTVENALTLQCECESTLRRIDFGRVAHDKTVEAAACDSGGQEQNSRSGHRLCYWFQSRRELWRATGTKMRGAVILRFLRPFWIAPQSPLDFTDQSV